MSNQTQLKITIYVLVTNVQIKTSFKGVLCNMHYPFFHLSNHNTAAISCISWCILDRYIISTHKVTIMEKKAIFEQLLLPFFFLSFPIQLKYRSCYYKYYPSYAFQPGLREPFILKIIYINVSGLTNFNWIYTDRGQIKGKYLQFYTFCRMSTHTLRDIENNAPRRNQNTIAKLCR